MAFGFFKIQHDAALVAIQMQEIRAHAGVAMRGDITRVVAFGRLDFDHIGAVVSENLRGVGAEDDRGQVDNAHAVEWTAHE